MKLHLHHAEKGSLEDLRIVMSVAPHTDAAGGLGYGVALVDLLLRIGDDRFAEGCTDLPPELKEKVLQGLVAGVAYHRTITGNDQMAVIEARFPRTPKALQ